MSDWTSGYVADIGYTYGYYQELNPLRARLAMLHAGFAPPQESTACELGFGQGLSVNIHAAASPAQWCATDFNPSQAAFARELAQVSGAGARLFDDAFEDFARRDDLPDFDFIGLHGIWSWISDDNRRVIVDFVRRRLKVGGVLYISYNTLPGWAAFAPMRHLMTEHAQVIGAEGLGIVSRIDGAIDFADKLLATNPLFARANPQVAERVKKLKDQNRHYLAHEYFNRDWHPMHFATMAQWLAPAKLQFACSAHVLDHIDAVNLGAEQQAFLKDIPDSMFRQSVRDFMVNQQFRRDYWVKGARRMAPLAQAEALRQSRVMLTTPRLDVPLKVNGTLGEAALSQEVYTPLLDLLADHAPRTVGQIEQALGKEIPVFGNLLQALMVLLGAGHLSPVQGEAATQQAQASAQRLNAHLLNAARSGGDINYLASPVTGAGVAVARFGQLFMAAHAQGHTTPAAAAQQAWAIISAQGQKLVKEGKPLATAEENLAELTAQAETFFTRQWPLLQALQVG
jgi:SAM-dependent methyltransferase